MSTFTPKAASALAGPAWLVERRAGAAERVQAATLPASTEEIWRYSRIEELDLDRFTLAQFELDAELGNLGQYPMPGEKLHVGHLISQARVPASVLRLLEAFSRRSALVVTLGGRVISYEIDPDLRANLRGPLVSTLAQRDASDHSSSELAREVLGLAEGPAADFFVELNDAFLPDAILIDIPAKIALEDPIVIVHLSMGPWQASFPRSVVRVGPLGQANVVEIFASSEEPGLLVPVTELNVDEDANLSYLGVQELGSSTWQLGYQVSRVGRDGRLDSTTAAFGGDYARLRTDSSLLGRAAHSELLAAYFAHGSQVHDFRTLQRHDAARSTSNLLFKGCVAGEARSVYSGLIRIEHGATKSDAFQTNRNLVLSEGAHADSVPNLDIKENDVRCSHASAVGPVDEDQRYYLESRGIPTGAAERLIVLGFFEEVLEHVHIAGARQVLRDEVAAKADIAGLLGGGDESGGTEATGEPTGAGGDQS